MLIQIYVFYRAPLPPTRVKLFNEWTASRVLHNCYIMVCLEPNSKGYWNTKTRVPRTYSKPRFTWIAEFYKMPADGAKTYSSKYQFALQNCIKQSELLRDTIKNTQLLYRNINWSTMRYRLHSHKLLLQLLHWQRTTQWVATKFSRQN